METKNTPVLEAAIPFLKRFTDGMDSKWVFNSINQLNPSEREDILRTAEPYITAMKNPQGLTIDTMLSLVAVISPERRKKVFETSHIYAPFGEGDNDSLPLSKAIWASKTQEN